MRVSKGAYAILLVCVCTGLISDAGAQATQPTPASVDYARDILPILSANCYKCHGPDEKERQMDLRFDTREGAFRKDEVGGVVILPGSAKSSELVKRIDSDDPDVVMPPADDIRKLTPAQKETLRRWIDQGAKWGQHWSFVAPVPATQPDQSIDSFIHPRLQKEGLTSSREADRATLIRRITFDLTGLPPTLAEVDAFLADHSPKAYESLIDRLLASPRYGERMATDWLDVARYADTHGYQMDRYRAMWPYRDWVIKAFNQNLPINDFLTWQLAGDLLPNPTKDQVLATAFNRLHMQNEEGGVVEEEFRVAYVVDRVTTMGTAMLGLTFECSRCHDHKYDPITQRDFYSMFAFFQNIDESGQTSFFTDAMPTPTLLMTDDAQDATLATLRGDIAAKENELTEARTHADDAFTQWAAKRPPGQRADRGLLARYTFDDAKSGTPIENPQLVDGVIGKAAQLSGENGFVFPGVGTFSRADAFSLALWLQTPTHAPRMVVAHKSKAPIDAASKGYELLLENGRIAFGLHHFWPGNSLKVVTKQAIDINQWTHVAVTYDGSSRATGIKIYIDGKPADLEIIRDSLTKDITYGGDEPNLAIGHRFRDNGFKGGKVDDFGVYNLALTSLDVAELAGKTAGSDALREYFLATEYAPALKAIAQLEALRRQENALVTPIAEVMVMREMPTTKPVHVLARGAYDAPREAVSPSTPAFLPPLPSDQPRNRLGLARWIVAPENPLTARVIVNRAWQQLFGRGIVETTENFGTQGAQPSHPELLDHLACVFAKEMHWDMKRLLKEIALSKTYQQSSHASAEQLARDPSNALLARGPARRLTAEMLRDQSLFDSNLLVEKTGGPSVRPYQPDGLWSVAMGNPAYNQDHGESLYRRSLYTFWKRSVPPPAMMTFDAADKNYCTVRRQSTSTPLQALVLLNDPQIVESARWIAQRMLTEGGPTLDARAAYTFRLITNRAPSEKELEVLKQLYTEQQELFTSDPEAAKKLLAVGEKPNDNKLDRADLAAGTVLSLALLNHDAAVMRR